MNFEQFSGIFTELKSLITDTGKVHKALQKLSPDFGGFYNDRAETLILKVLRFALKDKSDWIGYWIYELDWGKRWKKDSVKDKNGKTIKLKTIKDLWNILHVK